MTTQVLPTVKKMDEQWVLANWNKLQGGDYFLMATPEKGDDLVVHQQLDADGECFSAMSIGRTTTDPATREGAGFDITIGLFAKDNLEIVNVGSEKTIHLRTYEGFTSHRR